MSGGFSGFFVWDSVFSVMWARHFPTEFPITSTLDNFYVMQTPDGFICRDFIGWGGLAPLALPLEFGWISQRSTKGSSK